MYTSLHTSFILLTNTNSMQVSNYGAFLFSQETLLFQLLFSCPLYSSQFFCLLYSVLLICFSLMAKHSKKTLSGSRKSSCFKGKEKASSLVPLDSDVSNQNLQALPNSYGSILGKNSSAHVISECSKKKVNFDFDSSLNFKIDFLSLSNEAFFLSMKELSMVHGRIIDLDLLKSLHFPISFFQF